jgi:hypothetical protein
MQLFNFYKMFDILELWAKYKECKEVLSVIHHSGENTLVMYCRDTELRFLLHVLAFLCGKLSFSYVDETKDYQLLYKCLECKKTSEELSSESDQWCNDGCTCKFGRYCNSKVDYYFCLNCGNTFDDCPSQSEDLLIIKRNNTIVIGMTVDSIFDIVKLHSSRRINRKTLQKKLLKNESVCGIQKLKELLVEDNPYLKSKYDSIKSKYDPSQYYKEWVDRVFKHAAFL